MRVSFKVRDAVFSSLLSLDSGQSKGNEDNSTHTHSHMYTHTHLDTWGLHHFSWSHPFTDTDYHPLGCYLTRTGTLCIAVLVMDFPVISNMPFKLHTGHLKIHKLTRVTLLCWMRLSSVLLFVQGHGLDIYLRWMYGSSPTESARQYHIPASASAMDIEKCFSLPIWERNPYKYLHYSSTPREPMCPCLRLLVFFLKKSYLLQFIAVNW